VQVTHQVSALSFKLPKFGTWQRYILSDVEPITTMMDPSSSFIFENIPFHLKHHLFLKTKTFLFSKARLSIRKPFNKTCNQGMVVNFKEGNAAIV
jgi:fatty acid desaturase